ncbi:MAG: GNAT family N-acetyltransferase [Pyrinomonadaceae bacterium]
MNNGYETALRQCRFLGEAYVQPLYEAFIEAFSDYVISFALTETQFRNHVNLNAVDLERTVGCFEQERLVAFSLCGFGDWDALSTVYDAGTGVIPSHRRRGLSDAMFEVMVPRFRDEGIKQFLLEVATSNEAAIRLYEKLDFARTRELALLQCDTKVKLTNHGFEVREIPEPDWVRLTDFWDARPSWQNSVAAIDRSRPLKKILGAFIDDSCIGYIIFSSKFGRVAQIGVDRNRRRRGVGTALVLGMQAEMNEGYSMQVINIDKSLGGTVKFFESLGFYERLSQYEMLKTM